MVVLDEQVDGQVLGFVNEALKLVLGTLAVGRGVADMLMSGKSPGTRAKRRPMTTRLTIRFDFDAVRRLGAGKVALLESIDAEGSISAAGRVHKMSYRRAWLLVDQLNSLFATPLVMAHHGGAQGGGARLTLEGRRIVAPLSQRGGQDASVRVRGNWRHRRSACIATLVNGYFWQTGHQNVERPECKTRWIIPEQRSVRQGNSARP